MNKAQTGVTILIIMIASLFIGAIVAGVYIKTQQDIQSKALQSGDETVHDTSAIFFVMDIVGTDGSDGDIEVFKQLIKLPPGSDPIDLKYLNIILSVENSSASLTYAGDDATTTLGNGGFNTWTAQEIGALGDYKESVGAVTSTAVTNLNVDLDLDGNTDSVVVCQDGQGFCPDGYDGTYVQFNLSTGGTILVPLYDADGNSLDISVKDGEEYGNYLTAIGSYGYMTTSGNEGSTGPYTINAGQMTVFLAPITLNEDLDADGSDDLLTIDDTNVYLYYSSNGDVWEQLNNSEGTAYSLGADLSSGSQTLDTTISLTEEDANPDYGTITIEGTTSRASFIDEDVTFTVTPRNLNKGVFSAEYAKKSANFQKGVIHDGDVVRLYYETPIHVQEDQNVHVTIVTKSGGITKTEFYMPNIINGESITLYPPISS